MSDLGRDVKRAELRIHQCGSTLVGSWHCPPHTLNIKVGNAGLLYFVSGGLEPGIVMSTGVTCVANSVRGGWIAVAFPTTKVTSCSGLRYCLATR